MNWNSQPRLNGINMGDIVMGGAILFSGNQHAKVHMMCKFMNLGCPSSTQFFQVQRLYTVPMFWTSLQEQIIESRQGKEVFICGKFSAPVTNHIFTFCFFKLYTLTFNASNFANIQISHVCIPSCTPSPPPPPPLLKIYKIIW